MINGFIPTHGNYKELLSYQKSEIIYDITFCFCSRFLKKNDRTIDQMIQAARSGKQNIIEGTVASGTSKETEIKLLNVARASQAELLEDYRDFSTHQRTFVVGKGLQRSPVCQETKLVQRQFSEIQGFC